MTRMEQLAFLIHALAPKIVIPDDGEARWQLFRALMNVREPAPVDDAFLTVQDALLRHENAAKGITDIDNLHPVTDRLYLWQGDITTLRVDAIVNAANSRMLGCFCPCHSCIDNAIHTYAGVQLRLACAELMEEQGVPERAGRAKITRGYNLPSRYVLHTVGPVVSGQPTARDRAELASCYRACLMLAAEQGVRSIAFCCISTGEYHFPNESAAEIALKVTEAFLKSNSEMRIVFNVFLDKDHAIYDRLLRRNRH